MRVFLIAGEPSGDRLGGALMAGLRQLVPDVTFDGIGGAEMQARGLNSRFPMDELSVMGIAEILPRYNALMRRIRETAQAVIENRPDVLITIDSPDFCLRVARRVKAVADVRIVHYVAPTVWAWRPGRAEKMRGVVDQVLTLFPFEPRYMEAVGLRADFVGHPVVSEPPPKPEDIARLREKHRTGAGPVLLILPGSRRGEVTRLMPIFRDAVARLAQDCPDLSVLLPAAAPVVDLVQALAADWPVAPSILDPRGMDLDTGAAEKRAAFAAADIALAASGTVSLELAAAGTPMVIAYDMAWISRQILKRMLRVDTVTLVNLVSETRTVPECLGQNCRPEQIASALVRLLDNPQSQKEALALTMDRLGRGGEAPGLRAARAVLDGLRS